MQPVHWGWGVAGGAGLGVWYGDSWEETMAGALLGSPWGSRAIATTTHGLAQLGWWTMGTRAGLAARSTAAAGLSFAATAAAAVAGPVAAGYIVAHVIGGDRGTRDYTRFMTGKVSLKEYWDTVTLASMR